ncbi:phosphodiesterase [Cupriavidus sp. AU9028]|uniref:EAL domain-containing protein n=1 Tax=Cupriavidus sp. AU9028 TaxID=2871157 RepID=UPI001C95171B|nr:phosphodiesterase [Cupriavidus sp. AU9028]MBY4895977.1 phosphodiesterase [Cupriavidus sp. AU9028]
MSVAAPASAVAVFERLPPLHTVFQPIVVFESAELLGYEALLRGPQGTDLASPDALFRLARNVEETVGLEIRAARLALTRFAELMLPGLLFINFSASSLRHLLADGGRAMGELLRDTVPASRVVLELTEQVRVGDPTALARALRLLHEQGLRYALDDFGSGHANLDLLIALQPQFLKLDKSLVRGVAECSRTLEVMRSLLDLGGTLGASVIAEGIETADELAVLRDLGVPFGQGFHLGRPLAEPARAIGEDIANALGSAQIAVFPQAVRSNWSGSDAGRLLREAPTVAPNQSNNEVLSLFHAQAELHALAVVDDHGVPVGLIGRQRFIDRYAAPYHRELFGRKPCILLANRQPVCFERNATIETMAQVLAQGSQQDLADGFVITEGGAYVGLATGADLIRAVTEIRMEAARYANPLTLLPGNIPLNRHIERLLDAGAPFCACYADLNHFKPFNDVYGYWKGDEMIKGAAAILADVCDPARDFLGHVGGDDFLLLFQSPDWAARARSAIARFNEAARALYDASDRAAGGIHGEDRHGRTTFFPLVTLAIGSVRVAGNLPQTLEGRVGSSDIATAAAAAKREAKKSADGFALVELTRGRVALIGEV